MINGVENVYYYVQDMERAIAFYNDVLGCTVISREAPSWTALDCHGLHLGLHLTMDGEAVPQIPRDDHGTKAGGTLTLSSTDIDSDRPLIEASGVPILSVHREEYGHSLSFEDPDGNLLWLKSPP
jgi:catechol 2,3-dioxygenase-like lactoylglutathione lyase family enzyme